MKISFIFAGQGQQFQNMGIDLIDAFVEVKDIFNQASSILDYDLVSVCQDENKLAQTIYTQPALLTLDYAIAYLLNKNGINPDCVAGLSLGEYNALIEAKTLTFEDGLKIIKERAYIMDNALEKNSSSMAAVLKADLKTINEVLDSPCLNGEVAICNYNTYEQIVIGGSTSKLEQACNMLKEKGVKRVIPLKVSTVSHMHLLNDAAKKLNTVLSNFNFKKPEISFINNVAGVYQEDGFVKTLTKQIESSTYMAQTIELMLNDGIDTFIEVGPKNTISAFVKSIAKMLNKEVKIYNVYDLKTLEDTLRELGESNE
ncbi:[acyl-carrier-protein] S-malonyltransferase [Bacilli bacterium PM5-9]|nr:[acyl-carrier-protein] S-malonyltransferase [Bacilli bacterium PM5-9]